MFCKNCGSKLSDGAKFCPECGIPIQSESENSFVGCGSISHVDELLETAFRQYGAVDFDMVRYIRRETDMEKIEAKRIVKEFLLTKTPKERRYANREARKSQPNLFEIIDETIQDSKKIKCPKCKSTNVQVLGNDRKAFSVGKAVGGTLLTPYAGGVGALAGFAGKKGKYDVFCGDCGYRWKMK